MRNNTNNKKLGIFNRKGVFSHIQLAILAIVAIIIFSLFLYKSYTKMSDRMAMQDCKNSIAAHSLVNKGSFGEIFTDIKCPTREITIKKLKNTNEIIAEEMHRCWYIWDRGQGQYFQGDGNFCHICAIYQFGDKGREVAGLNEYLITHDVPVKYAGEVPGIKYIDYFQGYSTPNLDRKIDEKIQIPVDLDAINTSERYVTVFVYASGKDAIDKMLEGGKRTTAARGLALFGTAGTLGAATAAKVGIAAASGAAVSTAATGTAVSVAVATTEVSILSATGATASTFTAVSSITTGGGIIIPVTSTAGQAIIAGSTAGGAVAGGTAAGGVAVGGATAGGAVLGITPVGWVVIGVAVIAVTGYGLYTVLSVSDPEWIAYVAFRPYNADELKALSCDQMVVNQMSNVGR